MKEYRKEIDGLRAIAVIPVILYHAGLSLFKGGYVGVDIFFVISGYLITNIISNEMENNSFSLIKFYERRARRILPVLIFIVLFSMILSVFFLMPSDFEQLMKTAISVVTFSSNIFFWQEASYFNISSEINPLLHTWSLAVEEQFYIIFPLLLLLTWPFGKKLTFYVLILVFVSSIILMILAAYIYPYPNYLNASFYLLPMRCWEIMAGAILSLYLKKNNIHSNKNNFFSISGLLLIILSVFSFDSEIIYPSFYTFLPVLGTVLIITFAQKNTFVHMILSSKVLVGIGLISFSYYLWHQPIFAFIKYLTVEKPDTLLMLLISFILIPLSYLTWKFIEKPFRNTNTIKRKNIIIYLSFSILFIITSANYALTYGPFEGGITKNTYITNPEDLNHIKYFQEISNNSFNCQPKEIADKALKYKNFLRCKQSKESSKIDIALVGDSHVEHLFPGLSLKLKNKNITYFTQGDLPLITHSSFDEVFKHIISNQDIKTVILSMSWENKTSVKIAKGTLKYELGKTIDFLVQNGKKVILVGDPPIFHFHPKRCAYSIKFFSTIKCEMSQKFVSLSESKYLPILKNLKKNKNFEFIEIKDAFCNKNKCKLNKDNLILYRDNEHLNIIGSNLAAEEIYKSSMILK